MGHPPHAEPLMAFRALRRSFSRGQGLGHRRARASVQSERGLRRRPPREPPYYQWTRDRSAGFCCHRRLPFPAVFSRDCCSSARIARTFRSWCRASQRRRDCSKCARCSAVHFARRSVRVSSPGIWGAVTNGGPLSPAVRSAEPEVPDPTAPVASVRRNRVLARKRLVTGWTTQGRWRMLRMFGDCGGLLLHPRHCWACRGRHPSGCSTRWRMSHNGSRGPCQSELRSGRGRMSRTAYTTGPEDDWMCGDRAQDASALPLRESNTVF